MNFSIPRQARSASISQGTPYPLSLGHSFKNRESGRISPAGSAQSVSPLRRFASLGGGTPGAGSAGGGHFVSGTAAARRAGLRGSWAEVRDKYEYAVTVASASSDGGRG